MPAYVNFEYYRRRGVTAGGSDLKAFVHFLRIELEARENIQQAKAPRVIGAESPIESCKSTFQVARISGALALHTMTKERKGCLFVTSECETSNCDTEM